MDTTWFWVIRIGIVLLVFTAIVLLRRFTQGRKFRKDHIKLDGKVVIITGANTGIGKETAIDLAKRGAKIYLACRDYDRSEAARLDIIKKTGNHNIFNRQLDLASLESVRKFAKEFIAEETQLNILINNAGVAYIKSKTKDGFELQLGINHLGHFLLTNLLLDLIKKSAPSRIVVVSSLAHVGGKINKEDLMSEKSYNDVFAYCQSKLANILFGRELAKRLDGTGVTVNSLHPGVVNTEVLRNINPCLRCLSYVIVPFLRTPKAGAQTQIRLAVDTKLDNVTGKYFSDCKIARESKSARNDDDALWLWNESARLTDLQNSLKF